jgi:hypothetical protein
MAKAITVILITKRAALPTIGFLVAPVIAQAEVAAVTPEKTFINTFYTTQIGSYRYYMETGWTSGPSGKTVTFFYSSEGSGSTGEYGTGQTGDVHTYGETTRNWSGGTGPASFSSSGTQYVESGTGPLTRDYAQGTTTRITYEDNGTCTTSTTKYTNSPYIETWDDGFGNTGAYLNYSYVTVTDVTTTYTTSLRHSTVGTEVGSSLSKFGIYFFNTVIFPEHGERVYVITPRAGSFSGKISDLGRHSPIRRRSHSTRAWIT